MTIGVEYDYNDDLPKPYIGAEVARTGDREASTYFKSPLLQVNKSHLALFPVKFSPPDSSFGSYSSDRVLIFLQDALSQRFNIFAASMLLMWRAPGSGPAVALQNSSLTLDEFKQSDLFGGYVSVRYSLAANGGKMRVRVFDSKNPQSSEWFSTDQANVKSGNGLQLLRFSVKPNAASPTDIFKADTFEVELLDEGGKVVANLKKEQQLTWAKPK
jgi:hypothetical protein